ncbi:MAG: histidine kinase [Paludibacter sp.]|nr:histidine kinase [Paludibacter sp.]
MKYTETNTPNLRKLELIIYLLIWFGIFSVPYFQNRQFDIVNWEKVTEEWIRMLSFLIIFVLNSVILVPKLLFQKKYLLYIIYLLITIIFVIFLSINLQQFISSTDILAMPPMNLGPGMPPMELGTKMQPPMGYRPPSAPVQKSIFMLYTDNFIIAALIVAAGTTIKLLSQWLVEEGRRKDIEKEQLKTELAFLRHQVSPHFFMNTLNNIHALIDINTDIAKDAVIRLSTLMRYLLYDTSKGYTSLNKEIEFIESYISLMKLRFSEKVIISVDVPAKMPDIQIPPMLFISFLENAFKHGVSYQSDSFVIFKLEVKDNRINCSIRNSKHKPKEKTNKKYSGIGLTNIRKSLELLYNKEYTLAIHDKETEFEVLLTIPIYENKMLSH